MNTAENNVSYHLLCFCDASVSAYATALYLHQTCDNMETKSDLLFSKTRFAPLKKISIPRLEQMAVLIEARCVPFVKKQLKLPFDSIKLRTDSQCVLKW